MTLLWSFYVVYLAYQLLLNEYCIVLYCQNDEGVCKTLKVT